MKRKVHDPLVAEIELALMPGRFISYGDMFAWSLEKVEERLVAMVEKDDVRRAISLYEIFLSGCYEKIEECDDSSGSLVMFFQGLFCGWVKARQRAGCSAAETLQQILKWNANDQYGFFYRIEKDLANALDREGYRLMVGHFESQIREAGLDAIRQPNSAIFDYPNETRLPALSLKDMFEVKRDAQSYAALCERLGFSPRDCERLAEMEMDKRRWANALGWIEKGLALEPTRNWHNESSFSLAQHKPKLLSKLGRRDDALGMAWAAFENHPSDVAYEEFMRYVPPKERKSWHERAMQTAANHDIGQFMDLCVKTREWARLASRIHDARHADLEAVSHYSCEPAAR